jgi:hypothetical protein
MANYAAYGILFLIYVYVRYGSLGLIHKVFFIYPFGCPGWLIKLFECMPSVEKNVFQRSCADVNLFML